MQERNPCIAPRPAGCSSNMLWTMRAHSSSLRTLLASHPSAVPALHASCQFMYTSEACAKEIVKQESLLAFCWTSLVAYQQCRREIWIHPGTFHAPHLDINAASLWCKEKSGVTPATWLQAQCQTHTMETVLERCRFC